jgi:hypothetical protein
MLRCGEGIRHTRQFGKASYGSLEQALLQAQDWRDALVRSMPPIARREQEMIRTGAPVDPDTVRSSKRSRSEVLRKSNTSGVSGVHFKAPHPDHPGYWLAITYTAGKGSVSKAFSIKKHGDETAWRMAISEREKQLAQKSGDVDSSDPRPQ